MLPSFPHEIRPAEAGRDLGSYIASERETLKESLARHGAILFRGFDVPAPDAFEAACRQLSPDLVEYVGGGALRQRVSGRVYTSTELPADQKIPLHCESTYFPVPPERIWFHSQTVAETGGETPIGDMANVLAALPPDLVEEFDKREVLYFYNMHGGDGFGRGWRDSFGTDDRSEVEAWLKAHGMEHEWRPDGSLYAETRAPGLRVHGPGGKTVWGNQAASWHVRGLGAAQAKSVRSAYKEERRFPKHATFGDGEPIPDEIAETILATLAAEETAFPWQVGDVMLLDNHRIAHGRRPFVGERRVLVTLA